ncbi:HEAT repeat domain-containing protein [Streptomyces termitum]|uniref:HEAT repeat domain-containing protein n=1 Tax=Streptomyces termitum TaxID=67368 RepID=UPI00167BD100|nr:HEAT repeat domain-containing protein [Streptomyces termitum]
MRVLLHEDSDPGHLDAAFRLAVRMRAGHVAQLLLQYGADPGPSGVRDLLSLEEAADSGSPALVEALLDDRVRGRSRVAELLEARELTRRWHGAGVEAELRRRTGSREPVVRTPVRDDEYHGADEFALGGTTVRDGHGAILTRIEELLGFRASFGELRDRALAHAGRQDHTTWSSATILLAGRRDRETWDDAVALRTDPDQYRRLFGAEVLRLTHLFDESDEDPFAGPALDVFAGWSAGETDSAVLAEVLIGLGEHAGPRAEAALVPHAGHPEAPVRCAVARGLHAWSSPPAFSGGARTALLRLMADPDATVRSAACHTVAFGGGADPGLLDAMAVLLDDADRLVGVTAVSGLALHDDERCVAAARLLGPPQRGSLEEERCLDEVRRYEYRRDRP